MSKLAFDSLVVEVTRRCNIDCEHCLRGDPEAVNLQYHHLRATLSQCEYISTVTFTGGEPTLNLEPIQWFLNYTKEHQIGFGSFYIATNGVKISEEFIILCCKLYAAADEKDMCRVDLSDSQFHQAETDADTELLEALSFFGRKYGENRYRYESWLNQGRYAEYSDDGREMTREDLEIEYGRIQGTLYLNCEGNIIAGCDWSYESQRNPSNIVCKSTECIGTATKVWSMDREELEEYLEGRGFEVRDDESDEVLRDAVRLDIATNEDIDEDWKRGAA